MNATVDLDSPACADDHQRLEQEITLLAGQLNADGYRLLHLIANLDDNKVWCGGGTMRAMTRVVTPMVNANTCIPH
jgi:hypothetical protein